MIRLPPRRLGHGFSGFRIQTIQRHGAGISVGNARERVGLALETVQTFNSGPSNPLAMKAEKQPELVWQCLNCHRTFKGADAEQKALDCCGSIVQGWWANYNKWGKQKWYGR